MGRDEKLISEIWETITETEGEQPKKRGWPKGKKHTVETKRKMSEAKIGHKVNEDTKRKISEAQIGYKISEDTRRKMSDAQRVRRVREKKEKERKNKTA